MPYAVQNEDFAKTIGYLTKYLDSFFCLGYKNDVLVP